MLRSLLAVALLAAAAALLLTAPLAAQDALSIIPGTPPTPATEKARARHEYFHTRATYPGGEIPLGARVRATEEARTSMRLYTPQPAADGRTPAPALANQWVSRGPINIGGRVNALLVNPKRSETMFAAAADGGVWRSWDAGRSWHPVTEDLPTQAAGALAYDPLDTNVVYLGTGDPSFGQRAYDGAGIFRSTDAGTTWLPIGGASIPAYSRIGALLVHPTNPDILYASIPQGNIDTETHGIWRSTDRGASWQQIVKGRTRELIMNPQNPAVLYTVSTKLSAGGTAARYGVLKTIDGGDTWQALNLGVADSLIGRTGIALCASAPDVLYAAVTEVEGDPARLMGVFKSTDAGASWRRLELPLDYTRSQRGTLGWFANVVGVDPTNPDIVLVGSVKLLRSSDGGATWMRVADQLAGGPLHVDQHAIAFDPAQPDNVFVGNDGGVYLVRASGAVVEKRDRGMAISQFIGGDMHPHTPALLIGGTQDNGTLLSTGEADFDLTLYGDGGHSHVNPLAPNIMFASQETMKIWRSDNEGRTWTSATGSLPGEGSLFYIAWELDPVEPRTLYVSSYRIYKSTNEGRLWRQLQSCLFPTGTGSCYYVTAMSIAPYDHRTVLAAAPKAVALSTDAGETWTLKTGLPEASCTSVRSFTPGTIYTTYGRYGSSKVHRSTDFGATWSDITGNLPDIPVNDILELDGRLVLATDIGAFVSDNGGAEWQRFGTGMPAVSVQRFRWHPASGTLRAITFGRGMYDMQWSVPTPAAPVFTSLPDTTTLDQGATFVYAPVVRAVPEARFRLVDAPAGTTIDSVYGTVRWVARSLDGRFTVEASNAAGSIRQHFSVQVADSPLHPWSIASAAPMPTHVNRLSAARDRSLWIARDTGWVSRSTDLGATWTHHKLATDASVIAIVGLDAQTAIAGTGGPQALVNTGAGHLWKTTDGGATWRDMLYGIDGRFGNIWFHDAQHGIAVSQGTGDTADVYLTSDGGETWRGIAARPAALRPLYGTLAFSDRQNGVFVSSNQDVDASSDASVLRTTDGGMTWTSRTAGSGVRYLSDVGFVNATRGFACDETTGRVRRTVTGGQLWTAATYPMNGLRNTAIAVDAASASVWIVSDSSAWVSRDEGATWTRTTFAYTGPVQDAAFADSLTGWIVTKTGIVQRLWSNPVVGIEHPAVASDVVLGELWPNPVTAVRDRVTIPYRLATPTSLTLDIYTAGGRVLTTLVDGARTAGDHTAVWDASSVSSGVYFVTLRAGAQSITRRIVVAR